MLPSRGWTKGSSDVGYALHLLSDPLPDLKQQAAIVHAVLKPILNCRMLSISSSLLDGLGG